MNRPEGVPGVRVAPLPARPAPQLATLAPKAPDGPEWGHEIKYDGYRLLARIGPEGALAVSRRGSDYTAVCGPALAALQALPVRDAWFDGELVVLEGDGRTNFQALQNALGRRDAPGLTYVVFDLLHLDGLDLRDASLAARKSILAERMANPLPAGVAYGRHVIGRGPAFFVEACRLGLEGIVSKRLSAPYRAGRSRNWLKVKCRRSADAVIGGYTAPTGSRTGFGALLLGGREAGGGLRYAGKVGTGFNQATLRSLYDRLLALETDRSPFDAGPPRPVARESRWVRPVLVARIAFGSVTDEGLLRHAVFEGLREDVAPDEVPPPGP